MPFRDTKQDYRKSAGRRLEDARELLEAPTFFAKRSDADTRHLRGAVYLAGYAAECFLKAYFIQMMNAQTLREAMELLNERRSRQGKEPMENIARSAAGHQLYYLLQLTDLPNYPDFDKPLWGRLSQWRSSWRYEFDPVSEQYATDFVDDIQEAVNWIGGKLV